MTSESNSTESQESPEIIKAGKQCLGALIRAEQAVRKYYIAQAREGVAPPVGESGLVLIDKMSEYSQVLFGKYEHLRY